MANEDKKDFYAMLHDSKNMPKFQIITDQKSIEKYGGSRMYFAPPIDYDKVMKKVPYGKVTTVGKIREYFAKLNDADFTEPITAGIFVSIAAWASYQRSFFPAFSLWFYVLYLICGFTDMIDGTVARKSGSVSEFGSKLDTFADFIFVAACLIKLLPEIDIPVWILIWIVLIAVIKIINVVSGFICRMRFIAVHTVVNKVTGLLLFMFPLTLSFIEMKYCTIFVCGAATFAAIQEGHLIMTGRIIE